MVCECDKKDTTRNYYRYYDTPDGCDIMKKTFVTARYGAITGLILSSYDVLMYSRCVGLQAVLKRYMFHTVPLGLMGATFALVTNGALRYRQKDDYWNYFLGGFACGPILASYVGSRHAILLGGLILGISAMLKKDSIENDYEFFPKCPRYMNTVNGWRHDYTLMPDPREEMQHTCQ
ncbi:NADH dehydrogenase [ubiquinone] 1 alpha subcomplex subunit 11 [Manduca sexta]|uniref:NADH dehydrogenase [ubiquinone] 1 alpha subcomplex subunit 11 n=1 Tax=Manduca sexta TaxID=7130 RepID=UPI0011820AEB|nr:NADH dehydrogenase [ubiquinone] 1 alpha subcomplex subunit 11 [Manduca sexta]